MYDIRYHGCRCVRWRCRPWLAADTADDNDVIKLPPFSSTHRCHRTQHVRLLSWQVEFSLTGGQRAFRGSVEMHVMGLFILFARGWFFVRLLTVFQFERTNAKRLNRKTALSSFTHISVSAAVLSRQIMSKITRMWQADRCFVALAREYRFYLATRLTSASVVSSVHCNGYATVVWSEFGLLGSSFLRIRFDAVVWSKVLIGCLCLVVCSRTDGSRASLYNSNLSLVDKTTLTWVLMFESGLCLAWSRMNRSISLLTFAGWLCWYPSRLPSSFRLTAHSVHSSRLYYADERTKKLLYIIFSSQA